MAESGRVESSRVGESKLRLSSCQVRERKPRRDIDGTGLRKKFRFLGARVTIWTLFCLSPKEKVFLRNKSGPTQTLNTKIPYELHFFFCRNTLSFLDNFF